MRLSVILMGAAAILVFGCSTSKKKPVDQAAPVSTQQVTSTSQNQTTLPVQGDLQKTELVCKMDGDVRTLKVEDSQPKGCKLFYSNYSSKDPVAWSHMANSHCEQVRDRIYGKLQEAGFKCAGEGASQSSFVLPKTTSSKTQTVDAKSETSETKN